jgi:hypothetical protein
VKSSTAFWFLFAIAVITGFAVPVIRDAHRSSPELKAALSAAQPFENQVLPCTPDPNVFNPGREAPTPRVAENTDASDCSARIAAQTAVADARKSLERDQIKQEGILRDAAGSLAILVALAWFIPRAYAFTRKHLTEWRASRRPADGHRG